MRLPRRTIRITSYNVCYTKLLRDVSIVSCEKRRRHGAWGPAVALKTSYELMGDIGISGVVISDWIGRYADDPDVEYRIVLSYNFV